MEGISGLAATAVMLLASLIGGSVKTEENHVAVQVPQEQTTSTSFRLFIPGVATAPPETGMLFSKDDAPMVSDGVFGFPLAHWIAVTDRFGVERGVNRTHGGIDLATSYHEPVFATCDGMVVVSTFSELPTTEGYGNYIIIRCNETDWSMVYAHLSMVAVDLGQEVQRGLPIGRTGSTGFSTGEHLHFEIRYQGQVIDPEFYLDFGAPPREHPGIAELPEELPNLCVTPDGEVIEFDPTPGAEPTPISDRSDDPEPCPTPTPEVTETPTPEITPTPSPTATATPSATETPSPSTTGTASPGTGTPATSTPTAGTTTPAPTEHATESPTGTASPSTSPTATQTETGTGTPSTTASPSATGSPAAESTATVVEGLVPNIGEAVFAE